MEHKKSRTTEPLDRSWAPTPISARRKQAREPTPDLEDAPDSREWWSQLGSRMRAEAVAVAAAARNNARMRHTDKRDHALTSGGAGYSSDTLQTAPKAPRSTPVAVTNEIRCVSTAVPEDALRVSPQRTPTREKYRTAHCQQRRPLNTNRTRDNRDLPPPPLPPGWRMLLLVTVVLIVPQPPALWPPHAPGPWELKWPISGQNRTAHSSSPTQLAAPPPREPSRQPFGYVLHALTTHPHTVYPLASTPGHQRSTTCGNQSHPPQHHHTLVGLSAQISGQSPWHPQPDPSAHRLHGNDPPHTPPPPRVKIGRPKPTTQERPRSQNLLHTTIMHTNSALHLQLCTTRPTVDAYTTRSSLKLHALHPAPDRSHRRLPDQDHKLTHHHRVTDQSHPPPYWHLHLEPTMLLGMEMPWLEPCSRGRRIHSTSKPRLTRSEA